MSCDDNVISCNKNSMFEGTSPRNCDKRQSATETQKREGATKDGRKKEISLASDQTKRTLNSEMA